MEPNKCEFINLHNDINTSTKNGLYAIEMLCHFPSVTFRSETSSTAFEPLPTKNRSLEFTISNAIKSAALLYKTMPTVSIVFNSKFQLSKNGII